MGKRYDITIEITDSRNGEKSTKRFSADRNIGAWKQVLEETLRHITLAQLMTFLGKRKDLGFGWAEILGWICTGENDTTLLKEK